MRQTAADLETTIHRVAFAELRLASAAPLGHQRGECRAVCRRPGAADASTVPVRVDVFDLSNQANRICASTHQLRQVLNWRHERGNGCRGPCARSTRSPREVRARLRCGERDANRLARAVAVRAWCPSLVATNSVGLQRNGHRQRTATGAPAGAGRPQPRRRSRNDRSTRLPAKESNPVNPITLGKGAGRFRQLLRRRGGRGLRHRGRGRGRGRSRGGRWRRGRSRGGAGAGVAAAAGADGTTTGTSLADITSSSRRLSGFLLVSSSSLPLIST